MGIFGNDNNSYNPLQKVDNWIDEEFGFFSYFGIRELVKSALDNRLKEEFPSCPFTAGEIIAWARWNDEESFLMTAGGQAISGEVTADYWTGTPEVNPETGLKNSDEDINGALTNAVNFSSNTLAKTALGLGVLFLIVQYASSKATKLGIS